MSRDESAQDGPAQDDPGRDGSAQDGPARDDPTRRDEYADWTLPGQSDEGGDTAVSAEDGRSGDADTADEMRPPPTEFRKPLLRDRIRDRLGVTPRQWYVIETFLLVLPYPVFVFVYFAFDVDELLFLAVTLVYSLVATYVGFLS